MVFSAINTYEDEVRERTKRHTLEIQFEQALQVYKSALEAQKLGEFDNARNAYVKLFSFDVISLESSKQRPSTKKPDHSADSGTKESKDLELGPAIRLRAMALKNCAILLLEDNFATIDTINEALGYLQEALDLVGTDDKEKLVIPVMVQISWSLGNLRNARLGLEVLVDNNDGSGINALEIWKNDKQLANRLLSPRTIERLEALEYVQSYINGEPCGETPKFLTLYDHLWPIMEAQENQPEPDHQLLVSLGAKTWANLVKSLETAVRGNSRKGKRKIGDVYNWSSKEHYKVSFTGFLFNNVGDTSLDIQPQSEPANDSLNAGESASPQMATPTNSIPKDESSVQPSPSGVATEVQSTAVGDPAEDSKLESSTKENTPVLNSPEKASHKSTYTDPPDRLAKRRRIDRSKRSVLALPADFGVADSNFVSQINAYLGLCENLGTIESPAMLFQSTEFEEPAFIYGASDLKEILNSWDTRESNLFLTETSVRPQKEGIMTILRKGQNQTNETSNDDVDGDDEGSAEVVMQEIDFFVEKFNGYHVQIVRYQLAMSLLAKLANGGLPPSFGKMTLKFIDEIESMLYSQQNSLQDSIVLCIFGLYADAWISTKTKDLEVKVQRWQIISSRCDSVDHYWISAFVNQEMEGASPELSVGRFEYLQQQNEFHNDDSNKFTHLVEIPAPTNYNNLMQISKFKAAASFEKLLTPVEENDDSEADKVAVLESMLMPATHPKPESIPDMEFKAIQEFLGYVQPQFKLGLWYILLENYQATGSYQNSLKGLVQIFIQSMEAYDQGESLLSTLNVAHDVGKRLLPMLQKQSDLFAENLDSKSLLDVCQKILQLLQTLQLFIVYDDAVNSNLLQKPGVANWMKVFEKFRELVVMWWCIFYHFWLKLSTNLEKETVNDLLSIIHERLGKLGYCCLAESCLLKLHIDTIIRLDWQGSAIDFSQCLNCMYGFNLSLFGDLSNHHTVPKTPTDEESRALSPYFIQLITGYRSFGQAVVRNDIRQIIEELAKARVNTNTEMQMELVNKFIMQDFTPTYLAKCWTGDANAILTRVERHSKAFQDQGLNLIQGLVLLNQYKMRRRQTYNAVSLRIDTLESAIEFFKYDLIGYPNRIESWGGIAQAYALLTEDSVTFGKELGAELEAKDYCRLTLIALGRAVALFVQTKNSHTHFQHEVWDTLCKPIWPLFGKFLLISVVKPFEGEPLQAEYSPARPILVNDLALGANRVALKPPAVLKSQYALQVSIQCLGQKTDPNHDWENLFLKSKAAYYLYQLDSTTLEPQELIDIELAAKKIAPKDKCQEINCLILETLWKFSRDNKISKEYAHQKVSQIQQELHLATENDEEQVGSLAKSIEACLVKLVEKNKWLHEARYALCKLREIEYEDRKSALNELLNMFSLKSPTKPLVLWKHDTDLPGAVNVSMSKYVRYLADLMFAEVDNNGLLLLAKRFRKAGFEMYKYTECFEKLFGQCCVAFRKHCGLQTSLNAKQSDSIMPDLVSMGPEKFDQVVKRVGELQDAINEQNIWLQTLFYTTELKKCHIGPKTIAQADELVILSVNALLKFAMELPQYAKLESNSPTPGETKANKKTKLHRKDVLNAANQVLKPHMAKLVKLDHLSLASDLVKYIQPKSKDTLVSTKPESNGNPSLMNN